MSAAPVSEKKEFPPHREIAHVRQDLVVTKEILGIVKDENDRLRSLVDDQTREVSRLEKDLEETRRVLLSQIHVLEAEIARLKTSRFSLEEELSEALSERKHLSGLLHSVKGQVDGRLTKLIEELQQRDETIHKLEYQSRESEREIERLNRIVKADDVMELELEKVQSNYAKASAEVVLLQEQINQYQLELSSAREKTQQLSENSTDTSQISRLREVTSLLPLYRQWLFEVDVSLREIEDQLEVSLDDSIDSLAYVTSPGIPYKPPSIERQRLVEMKKFERGRKRSDPAAYYDVCESYEESLALYVRTIRDAWDSARHLLEKVKVLSRQLSETTKSVVQVSGDLHVKTMPGAHSEVVKSGKSVLGESEQPGVVGFFKNSLQLQHQYSDDDERKKNDEIVNLKTIVSMLESEKDLLGKELSKARQDAASASVSYADKARELECKLRDAVKSSEELSAKTLNALQLEHEREKSDIMAVNSKLQGALEIESGKAESMKKLLVESKRRRFALKEENHSIRKNLREMEGLLSTARVELLNARRTIDLLHAELQFAKSHEENSVRSTTSNAFSTFKREIQRNSTESKTVFLPRPL
ncbi:hypothetical protein DQ04_07171030 [Trypanosoma grayi]|uniref:hypothetical protein n=1 Tax=Trypanosoma grayi TaxID=71804 RepID=UPI0004F452BD|nr:hypothetical protein DQ04_07171030 [Trypanosoma grayi]KEG08446.1 hypothetical protein DQ04_07171030 [Trypanosoma grayi]